MQMNDAVHEAVTNELEAVEADVDRMLSTAKKCNEQADNLRHNAKPLQVKIKQLREALEK